MEIDLEGTVVSAANITAPFSGARACAVHVEAVRDGVAVGVAVLGDLLRLRTPAGDVELVARRAAFTFVLRIDGDEDGYPLRDPIPAELVPLLRFRPDRFRERCIVPGDRFRVRASVEPQRASAAAAARFFVADGRSLSRLDEDLSRTA